MERQRKCLRGSQNQNQRARGAGEGYPPVWAATSFFRSPTVSSSLTVKVRFWKRERGRRGVRLWGGYFEARALEKVVVRDRQGQTPVVEGHCRGRPTDRARSGEASQNRLPPLPLAAGGGGGGALQTRTYLHFTLIFLPRRSFRITSIMINSQQGRLARVCESTPRGAQPAAAPLHTPSALSHPLQQKWPTFCERRNKRFLMMEAIF